MGSKSGQPSELRANRNSCGTGDQAAKGRWAVALIVVAFSAAFACGGGSSDTGGAPAGALTGPTGGGGDQFTWSVDGQNFQASSNGMSATLDNGAVFLIATDCSKAAGISLTLPADSTGTFPAQQLALVYTPDGRNRGSEIWVPDSNNGGSATVSSASSSRISGNFSFTLVPGVGSSGSGRKSLQGTFNLAFGDRQIC